MASALPQAIRLRLEQALAQWRLWRDGPASAPVLQAALAGGRSNHSLLVSSEGRGWVVRIDGKVPARLGLSRSAEWRALELAAAQNLCPQPVYRNPELGVLVTAYCEPDDGNRDELQDIAALLRGIHALPPLKFRLDPMDRAQRYLRLLGRGELTGEFVAACERLARQAIDPALCHNDLLRANRLCSGGGLLALDWEYVAVGDPLFDLAVIIEGDRLDEQQAGGLLSAWADAEPGESLRQRLADNRLVYRELARLWERLDGQQRAD